MASVDSGFLMFPRPPVYVLLLGVRPQPWSPICPWVDAHP